MDDLISRQAAIDIERNATVDTNPSHFEAHQKFTQFMDDAEISSFGRWQWSNGFNTALTAVGIDLKKLPSAQQWIPCSERLPDEDLLTGMGKQFSNSVLMTVYDKNDEDTIVDYGHTTDGEWYSETADEYVESIADWKVIAWMPLPLRYEEPFKGEQE